LDELPRLRVVEHFPRDDAVFDVGDDVICLLPILDEVNVFDAA
jgi:hypothetical protein